VYGRKKIIKRSLRPSLNVLERPETTSSNEESLNTTTKIIIGLFCLAIVVVIGLAIVVGCLQKKLQRYIKLFNLISLESMINFFHACPHHTILASSCEKSIIIPYCLLYLFNIVIYQLFFISSTCKCHLIYASLDFSAMSATSHLQILSFHVVCHVYHSNI
jgi:hypothetical protein